MTRKILRIIGIMLSATAFAGIGGRLYWINARYPGPIEQTCGLGDSVQVGDYTVTFQDWRWSDGEILHALCPGFCLLLDEEGEEYPVSRERIGLITLTITKAGTDQTGADQAMTDDAAQMPDLTGMAFESGAWGNQFDMELMYLLNPRLESLRPRLEEGEGVEIILPMTMTDQQFTREQWERIDRRAFYLVLDYYLVKTRFELPSDCRRTP